MKQNVHLIIGDNASGKTRYLEKVIEYNLRKRKKIVTNIPKYEEKSSKKADVSKLEHLKSFLNTRFLNIAESSNLDDDTSRLYKMLYMSGDVLVLDEVDMMISNDDLMNWSSLVPFIREYWEAIYITGYSFELDRVFYGTTKETYSNYEYYADNYRVIDSKLNSIKISEGEADEYFGTI